MPEPYRRLDTAVLEALVLRGALGMTRGRHLAPERARLLEEPRRRASSGWRAGAADAGFFMRATPVEQVREVAEAGESMPPKSTYFYPKVPTGLVFNPLESDEDLHAQGRRRHHRPLVRRPRAEVRRPPGGVRLGRRGRPRRSGSRAPRPSAAASSTRDILRVQRELFVAGAELATAPEAAERLEAGVSKVTPDMVDRLEGDIDRYMDRVDLPPKFVIPGRHRAVRAPRRRARGGSARRAPGSRAEERMATSPTTPS